MTVLIIYAAVMIGLTTLTSDRRQTISGFLIGNWNVKEWPSAFSIAATWIWAPALFIAAQQAYVNGIAGVFWFTVPNVLALIIFAYFAVKIRDKMTFGYSLTEYMGHRFGSRVEKAYLIQKIGLAICSFAVQLIAGGAILSTLTQIDYYLVTLALAGIALSYSLFSGLRASVITDYAQMVIILAVGFILIPWTIHQAGGLSVVWQGIGGVDNKPIWDADVFLSFGLATTIGLMSGPFGDQSFWQRSFATQKEKVKGAFIKGSLIFAVVPVLMSLLGFIAAGAGLKVTDLQLTNLETVQTFLPAWAIYPFVFMILAGLGSTLDSNLAAIASLIGKDSVKDARLSMVALTVLGLLVSWIPGIEIVYLFMFYGTLRATTLLPTVTALLTDKMEEKGVFYGILVSFVLGLPIFVYGNFMDKTGFIVAGSLITVLTSGLITYLWGRFHVRKKASCP